MRRRLYFMAPDIPSARSIRDELLLARIEDGHIHVLARDGVPLEGMQEASILQKTDFVHGAETGLVVGGGIGILAGMAALLFPPAGVDLQLATILVTAFPNSRLKTFEAGIQAGRVLMMVDVPASRVDEIRQLVASRHPEANGSAPEPTIPAFP